MTIGAYHPGIEHDAMTASGSVAGGVPGRPNGTRRPVS
jgi:hypothetical protein